MKVFKGFEYRRGTTPIHALDPRAKLVYLMLFMALAILYSNPLVLIMIFASSLPMVAIARVFSKWAISIRGSFIFVAFIFLFNLLALYFWGGNTLEVAVLSSLSMAIRFISLISIFSTFFLTTSPEDMTQSMVQMKIPYDYALTFNMAMRFVPTLSKEAQYIMDAQKSRGLEMEKGNLVARVKNYIPVLIPLIISSFRRAELVADAMESRAFGASKKRTSIYVLRFGGKDALFVSIALASFFALLSLRLLLSVP